MAVGRPDDQDGTEEPCGCGCADRRSLLRGALAIGLTTSLLGGGGEILAADDPSKSKPQPGDVFVHIKGKLKDQVVKVEDLPVGGPQTLAFPKDPKADLVRKGSRLNQVVLARFAPDQLKGESQNHSAEGVVAFSAICTHQGCPVSFWKKDKQVFYCSCHGSQFDPRDGGKKVFGPAERRLAILPVKIENGTVLVAGEFIGTLGPAKSKA